MLKKVILGVLLIPALALAEPVKVAKPVVCDKLETMFEFFADKYKETPFWVGDVAGDEQVVILSNSDTRTWTIVQFSPSAGIACVLESGTGIKFKFKTI